MGPAMSAPKSGDDIDQVHAFMKMEPTEQMEIMIRVDLLNGDMCKKKLSKAEREGPLHDRLGSCGQIWKSRRNTPENG